MGNAATLAQSRNLAHASLETAVPYYRAYHTIPRTDRLRTSLRSPAAAAAVSGVRDHPSSALSLAVGPSMSEQPLPLFYR